MARTSTKATPNIQSKAEMVTNRESVRRLYLKKWRIA